MKFNPSSQVNALMLLAFDVGCLDAFYLINGG